MAELRNPDTNTAFYVTMHAYSPSSTLETFKLNVNTSEGACEYQARRAMHGIMSNGLQLQSRNSEGRYRSTATRLKFLLRTSTSVVKGCFTPRQRSSRMPSSIRRRSWSSGFQLESPESSLFVPPHLAEKRPLMAPLATHPQASSSILGQTISQSLTPKPQA